MIRTENLTKEYDGFKAVNNLTLQVEKGEIYGFLGPNGAGKTTTILMLLGILKPTRGKIYLMGEELKKNPLKIKKRIGVVSEKQFIYKEMSAQEYLNFFADLYKVENKEKRIDELLSAVNLLEIKKRKLGAFSRGMQQKLGFVRALLHNPEILLLDEPVSGLDPTGIKQIRDLIKEENERGKTVFISSHLLSEVERLCDKVGIINKGKLLAEDTMDNLKARLSDFVELEVEVSKIKKEIVDVLSSFKFVKELKTRGNLLNLRVASNKDYRAQISQAITQQKGIVLGIKKKEMSLEDAFITITQKNISLLTISGKEVEK
ncbi:ABC transporter ATP-binding protein [Patescibacteria group bacterium]|nr:ABC transporter ATP-binding protein [Patescibacteria group bacterium]